MREHDAFVQYTFVGVKVKATARDLETTMLDRCVAVAQGDEHSAKDQREANVFRLASLILPHSHPRESKRLLEASEQYFSAHPSEKLPPADVIKKGWVVTLPRLRDMLSHRLNRC